MTVSQMTHAFMDIVANDNNLQTLSTNTLGDRLYVYLNEDLHRLGTIHFPYCHIVGIGKNEESTRATYTVFFAFSALLNEEIKDATKTYNDTYVNLENVIDAVKSTILEEIESGINGESGFEILATNTTSSPQNGQKDVVFVVEMDILQRKC